MCAICGVRKCAAEPGAGEMRDAVDLMAGEVVKLLRLDLLVSVGEGDDAGVASLAEDLLDGADAVGHEGTGDIRDDETDGSGAFDLEAAGELVALIAELLNCLADARGGLFADVALTAEGTRGGTQTDAGELGNVDQSRHRIGRFWARRHTVVLPSL